MEAERCIEAEFHWFQGACGTLGLEVSVHQIGILARYRRAVVEWNSRVNLVSRKDVSRLVRYHFLDSAEGLIHLRKNEDRRVLDLGSGAGFPGIVWKILSPALEMILVDSVRKRSLFLERVVEGLGLENTAVVRARGEELQERPEFCGRCDVAVARTVARLSRLVNTCVPLLRPGGRLVAFKGAGLIRELAEAEGVLEEWGGEVVEVARARSVQLRGKRRFVVVERK